MAVTRVMVPEDIGLHACRYVPAYSSACGRLTTNANRICDAHTKKCKVCGALATNECNYCGQFVCGAPLCDECEGHIEPNKPSGNWNHGHRRKESAQPVRKMVAADIGVSDE